MKLLHTGDLHLDSPFAGESVQASEKRREGQRRVLRGIFETARSQGCDMILIAGDLFDGKYVTPETAELCLGLFAKAECPVILAPGNHDPFVSGSFYQRRELPENVYVFSSSELQHFFFEKLNARVYGYAFTGAALTESPLAGAAPLPDDGMLRIFCGHGDLNAPLSRYAPLPESDLGRMGFDYCALGHVHNLPDYAPDETIRYCGFPEGRSYDELGDGGAWLVELLAGEKPRMTRIRLSETRYLWEELSVRDGEDEEALCAKIRRMAEACAEDGETHLRLTVTGNADPLMMARITESTRSLGESIAELQLIDRTVPYVDGEYLERDTTLRGAFYRALYPKLIHEDVTVRRQAVRALQIGLAAMDQRRIPEEEQGI